MLSLISTKQSDPALINSTDATIRNPTREDNTVACENAAVCLESAHAHLESPVAGQEKTEDQQ